MPKRYAKQALSLELSWVCKRTEMSTSTKAYPQGNIKLTTELERLLRFLETVHEEAQAYGVGDFVLIQYKKAIVKNKYVSLSQDTDLEKLF